MIFYIDWNPPQRHIDSPNMCACHVAWTSWCTCFACAYKFWAYEITYQWIFQSSGLCTSELCICVKYLNLPNCLGSYQLPEMCGFDIWKWLMVEYYPFYVKTSRQPTSADQSDAHLYNKFLSSKNTSMLLVLRLQTSVRKCSKIVSQIDHSIVISKRLQIEVHQIMGRCELYKALGVDGQEQTAVWKFLI